MLGEIFGYVAMLSLDQAAFHVAPLSEEPPAAIRVPFSCALSLSPSCVVVCVALCALRAGQICLSACDEQVQHLFLLLLNSQDPRVSWFSLRS